MVLANGPGKFSNCGKRLLVSLLVLPLLGGVLWAQGTATITGSVKDTSGAVIPGTAITAKNLETGLTRAAETDESGNYRLEALPVGPYEVGAEKAGFKMAVRRGITLVVAQQAIVDLSLEVGTVAETVTVTAAAALVNTTLSSTSGLINEQQVKDLPLNGRSFDQLLTLNAGTTNYSSASTNNRTAFTVSGRRPDENRFLLNGIDYLGTGGTGVFTNPAGASGQVLGVEAVREFNVLTDTYGAEYGKRSGGQVNIVTSSGTNQLHGSAFEYLRNSALDARNFFDVTKGPPPFRRNQFGGSLGGPLKRDKLFLFGAYEGFRQRLGSSGTAVVPDADARRGLAPIGPNNSLIEVPNIDRRMLGYMVLWREPNGPKLGGGGALAIYNPVAALSEENGQLRFDYSISANDSLSGNYLADVGSTNTPSSSLNTVTIEQLENKVVSLQETRIFSPTLLNIATVGYSRAYYFTAGNPTVPFPASLQFIEGVNAGSIAIGAGFVPGFGSIVSASGGGRPGWMAKNMYTVADNVNYSKGRHSFSFGASVQRYQENTASPPSAGNGQVGYATLTTMLQDIPTAFQAPANLSPTGWRQTQAAWYVQDDIKLKPNLNLRLGLRDEMTSGYNESHCRAANYGYDAAGIILTEPSVGCSALTQNNAQALWSPRVGLAWDPTGTGSWSVRAGFSIAHDLQDELVFRLWNVPLNGIISKPAGVPLLSYIPLRAGTLPPLTCNFERIATNQPCAIYSPSGVEPTFHTPTIQQWSLTIERQLSTNLMLQVRYVGSEDFHMPINVDMNIPTPQRCADPAGCVSGGVGSARGLVPQGKEYLPPATVSSTNSGLANPYLSNTYSWFFRGTSNYHALDLSLVKRMSSGFSFKTNYSFSKGLDITSGTASITSLNTTVLAIDRYNIGLDHGLSLFNVTHQFNTNFGYELPFGSGKRWGSGATGFWGQLISGWQWNGIVQAQTGFPLTAKVGANRSGSGDTRSPDRPDRNPTFTGPLILGTPRRWFDPTAFVLPIPGTFGNSGRSIMTGPGLFTLDTSLFKKIRISERFNLQFRAEMFNVANHANFGFPNFNVFSGNNINPAAGLINSTATPSRQLQFALRLTF